MSLNSEQADNRSLLISELKREPQESQEKLSKEALFELEFVDGSISVALSLLMVEKPPLSSPQLHLKISLIPPIKDNEQLPRQNQNLEVLWPNRSMIQ